jgi:hypothetical protein
LAKPSPDYSQWHRDRGATSAERRQLASASKSPAKEMSHDSIERPDLSLEEKAKVLGLNGRSFFAFKN